MNRKEEILHQQISEAWNNSHLKSSPSYTERQRLICNWTNQDNKRAGGKARTMGVKKGVANWMYLANMGRTIWIELKTEDGIQSQEQINFQHLCLYLGHEYYICRDYYHFWELIGILAPFQLETLLTIQPPSQIK